MTRAREASVSEACCAEVTSANSLNLVCRYRECLGQTRARDLQSAVSNALRDVVSPDKVDRWWRVRQAMRLVRRGGRWQIEGAERHRARIAYAGLQRRRVFDVEGSAPR